MASQDKQKALTEPELLNLVRQYELASLGSSVAAGATISTTMSPQNGTLPTLETDRFNALNMYFARPLGNEIENRSQIVLPELRDTVEWMMPQLMRMFVGGKQVVRFDPESEGDQAQAELETAACMHVFRQNNGDMILYDFFKDALLLRNGYTKTYWKVIKRASEERYTGLSEQEVTLLLQDKSVEPIEQNESTIDLGGQQIPVFDVKLRRSKKVGSVCLQCVPPEEMRVSPHARDAMNDIQFAQHIVRDKTRSDLIAEGYDKDLVNSAQAGRPTWVDMDSFARNQTVDQFSIENPSEHASQLLEVRDNILQVDFDGDGIAELRHVVIIGDQIAENEVCEETMFSSCVPKRMPHRHTGISLYDEVADIQVIKTKYLRGLDDNMTISINGRMAVDHRNCNFDDLLSSRPGGVVRGNGPPSNWIMPIPTDTSLPGQIFPMLEYFDKLRANRTGIGEHTMGLDADELQNVTKGAQLAAMSAASLKLEMCARLLAEGVKDVFWKIRALLMRHQDQAMQFQMAGKWVTVNPSQWGPRNSMSVNVGLGSGNQEEQRANALVIAQAQAQLMQVGMVGPKQMYETFKDLCQSLGRTNPERYAMEPGSPEFKEHQQQMQQMQQNAPPAPQVQAAKIRAQTVEIQEQAQNQREQAQAQVDLTKARTQMIHEALQNQQDRQNDTMNQHKGREVQMDSNHLQIILKLIPAVAQILAAEKAAANQLGPDVEGAAGAIQ